MPPQLENFDAEKFLRDYWQKKPLFIKNPWNQWRNPLEPDELAGLACEDDIESRLVIRQNDDWIAEHGPFADDRFGSLGKHRWTLLVQAVDHSVAQVAALIEPFRFIPNWRIDDVMVSYATDRGGVGLHFDQYDVFLIQGLGKRRWQIGTSCDENTKLAPNDDLKLLAEFESVNEWICEPGDILYIPPGISHNGAAMGDDCMTYSIGFRAPSRAELVSHWVDEIPANIADDRYNDPDLNLQENPGEISSAAIDQLHAMVTNTLAGREDFAEWFGIYNSTSKYPDIEWAPEEALSVKEAERRLTSGAILKRNPVSRFSFIRRKSAPLMLFVDGQMFECEKDVALMAEHICAQNVVEKHAEDKFSEAELKLLRRLLDQGSLYLD